jgi:hypothetical protein
VFRPQSILLCQSRPKELSRLGHTHDASQFGMLTGIFGIPGSPTASTDDQEFYRSHVTIPSFLSCSISVMAVYPFEPVMAMPSMKYR